MLHIVACLYSDDCAGIGRAAVVYGGENLPYSLARRAESTAAHRWPRVL
jgi:hypothetical protein